MTSFAASHAPPFCPNPQCRFHRSDRELWRCVRAGFYARQRPPHRVQRYRCCHCRRQFSTQTFRVTYWLKRPDLLPRLTLRLLACSAYRQIGREFDVSPQTIALHAARLGRHALLFHQRHRPRGPIREPLCLDSFVSFEWSQYFPTAFHLAVGQQSHFFYGFLDSELRRSGRMTTGQKRRRQRLEEQLGRPDPRATELDCAALLQIVAPHPQSLELWSDEHTDYPKAVKRVSHLHVAHRTISSRAARTPQNPLFPVNLLDLKVRHTEANH
jgi:transposase-like protein